jgi:hypothetical protein
MNFSASVRRISVAGESNVALFSAWKQRKTDGSQFC